MKKNITFLLFLLVACSSSFSQNLKTALKNGDSFLENKKYKDAETAYTEALGYNANNVEALIGRGTAYENLNNLNAAIADYTAAQNANPVNTDIVEKLAHAYFLAGNYQKAITLYSSLTQDKKKSLNAYTKMSLAKIKMKDFNSALNDVEAALKIDNNDFNANFYKGVALDSIGNYGAALKSYEKAINSLMKEKKYKESLNKSEYKFYYINPARTSGKVNQWDNAFKYYVQAEEISPNDITISFYRAETKTLQGDISGAIGEYSNTIARNSNNVLSFIKRGHLYLVQGNAESALSDFSRAIALDDKNAEAYYGRALGYDKLSDSKNALINYEKALLLVPDNALYKKSYDLASISYKEKFRESNKPELIISAPKIMNNKLLIVPQDESKITITGRIKDESKIASITINDIPAKFDKNVQNPEFNVSLETEKSMTLTFYITDVYNNTAVYTYDINRVVVERPVCELITPSAPNGQVFIQNNNNYVLYVEGVAHSNNMIKNIIINDHAASFDKTKKNPNFSANIETAAIDHIVIKITDVYENESVTKYAINRSSFAQEEANPMGKTWVVFIENSNYSNLSSLESVSGDVAMVRNALSGYIIDSIISYKNMKKATMERFFSIELRDMIAKNQVKSLLIWYSGHGKVSNDNGYWIPVDGSKKDEFSYFNTNNLKGYLGTYKNLKHTLVIADATETGPSFYLAMRASYKPKSCGDYEASKLKSAQVLSASEPERLNESSLLSTTFSKTLKNTPDKCVSIDNISERLNVEAKQKQKQKPKFGNIQDLTDENGSFFFLKKQ